MRDEGDVTDLEAVLPRGWTWSTIGEVAEINPSGRTVSPPDGTPVSFLPMAAVEELTGRVDTTQDRPFGEVKKGFTRFREGDLLFAKITPSMENGKIAVARGLSNGLGCGTTEFHVLRPTARLDVEYLRYIVLRDCFRGDAKRNMAGAVGQQRVPKAFLEEHRFPLPPLSAQQRIVSRIEELFSKIDAGEQAISDARKALRRYRTSVLKAAVTGELTSDWRAANGKPEHSGAELLADILEKHRATWEDNEKSKLRSKGKSSPKSKTEWAKFRARYKHPAAPEDGDLPELPDGWALASLDALASEVTYGTSAKCSDGVDGIPVLRMGNLGWGTLDFSDLKFLPRKNPEFPDLLLRGGDLLFNRTNSAELVGKSAVFRGQLREASFASYLIRVRLTRAIPEYVAYFINSVFGRAWIRRVVSQQVGQANVNGSKLKACAIPLPPEDEQAEIVSRVEEALSRADATEAALDQQIRAARALRQSILKSAFVGHLVSQEPAGRPADQPSRRERRKAPA